MIEEQDMVITISHQGYIKRTSLAEYRTQSRGGVGSRGAGSKDDDFTEHLFIASTHSYLLIFTQSGKLFWIKAYNVPEGNKTSKGRPLQNLIQIEKDDKVKAVVSVKNLEDQEYINNNYLIMCTKKGTIKKTTLEAYSRPRANGINAITINEGDTLLDVRLTSGKDEIVLATKEGMAVRFHESTVRPMGRTAAGVKGISIDEANNEVIGMVVITHPATQLLVISEKGYGKRSDIEEFRLTNRGAKGVKALNITEKTGHLVSIMEVTDKDQLMIMTQAGIAIRFSVSELRVMGRNTQGVRVIRLNEDDDISSIAKIEMMEEEREEENAILVEQQNTVNTENLQDFPPPSTNGVEH
jgi:DNA gyrase subunit A